MKWIVGLIVAIALLVGLWFGGRLVWATWKRYTYQRNWIAGTTALANYQLPSGTVIMDPAAGPTHHMQEWTEGNRSGKAWVLKIPTDPTLAANLQLMQMWDSSSAYPFARELMTGRGRAFVRSLIEFKKGGNGPPVITLRFDDSQLLTVGGFPSYKFRVFSYMNSLDILPDEEQPLPTILSGELDAGGMSWTLPLVIGGKKEWVRFDHSGPTWAVVTASFGKLDKMGSVWRLKY